MQDIGSLQKDEDSEMPRGLSQLLLTFEASLSGEVTSIDEITQALHERGFGALLFIFALPAALPLPVPPGINLLIAFPLILLSAQQLMGRQRVWLPNKVKQKTISSEKLKSMIDGARPWVKRLERIISPRFGFVTQGVFSRIVGLCCFIMALSVTIPIPLSNTVPSFAIAVMSVGVLMRDGLAVIGGALIGLSWVIILYSLLIFLGAEGVEAFKDLIKAFLS